MDELQTLSLPLLPLTSGVVLPGMVVTMAVESDDAGAALAAARNGDGRLVLVPRLENGRYANVGTVAAVETAGELPSGLRAVVVRGVQRARRGAGVPGWGGASGAPVGWRGSRAAGAPSGSRSTLSRPPPRPSVPSNWRGST